MIRSRIAHTLRIAIAMAAGACGSSEIPSDVATPAITAPPRPPEARVPSSGEPPLRPTTGELNGGCAPDGVAGHQTKTCADGVTFDIDVPERCLAGRCGIILDVHGWSMTGPMQGLHTRFAELTRDQPYLVIAPTAPGKTPSWGKGKYPFSQDFAFDETVWSYFEATATRFHANEEHLHATGFSQGAMMAFRLAFAHADRLAAIAPIAGPSGFAQPAPFKDAAPTNEAPPREIPILYLHGTKDRELKFEGNAVVVRDAIVKTYGLGAPEAITTGPGVRASRYRKSAGADVLFEFWEHDYATDDGTAVGGHCVPGPVAEGDGTIFGKTASPRPFRCVDAGQAVDAGVEILRFFQEHPKTAGKR